MACASTTNFAIVVIAAGSIGGYEAMAGTFDPESHTYTSGHIRFPGATDIIKAEGLIDPLWLSDQARWRGKCVHKGIELLVQDALDWSTVDDAIAGYLRSFARAIEILKFQILGSEMPCFDLSHGCIPDLWGILNDQPTIIELKTGPIPAWAAIQTALQRRALKTHTGFVATKRFGLRLMADGSFAKLVPFEDARDDRRAMGMVDSWWWKQEHGYIRWEDKTWQTKSS